MSAGTGDGRGGRTAPGARPGQGRGTRSAGPLAAAGALALTLLGASRTLAQEPARASAQEGPTLPPAEQRDLPIVRGLRIEGADRAGLESIQRALGLEVGKPFDPQDLDRTIGKLFDTLHVFARVYQRPAPDGVELRVVVDELPSDREPRFLGNVEIESEKLYEWAGLSPGDALYLYRASRVRERLLQRYREEGFAFVEIDVVERPPGIDQETGERLLPDVIFEIREGPRVRVRDVVQHGNVSLPDGGFWFFKHGLSKLAELELRGPRLFRWFAKNYSREALDADLLSMREVYRDYGYLDAVVELDHLEFSAERDWVTVHVAIDEGQRYTVGSLVIEGVERYEAQDQLSGYGERPAELVIPESELLEGLKLEVGKVYERRLQKDDQRALRKTYGKRGYIDHNSLKPWDRWTFLEPELVFEQDRPVVHVVYRIAQGRPIYIREISIAGNLHTQDRVARRSITVQPGELADAEEIERARTRLISTGFFTDDRDPAHVPPRYRFIDTEESGWKDLEFELDEGSVLTFNLSGGVSSNAGLFGVFDFYHRNFDVTSLPSSPLSLVSEVARREAFHGAGQELRLRASPGTQVSFFDILFREPDLFLGHTDRIGLALNANKRQRNYDSHDEHRQRFGFELSKSYGPDAALFAGFSLQTVEVRDIDASGEPSLGNPLTVPADLKAQEGTNDLSYLSIGYRYSVTDNRVNPRNGNEVVLRSEVYNESLASDFDFAKLDVQYDWYNELDEDPDTVSGYFHFGLGSGVAVPYGGTKEVPYTERFFLGGQSTLRGFDFRGVGKNENGFPIGGQTYISSTLELKYPLVKDTQPGTYREVETIRGGLFCDLGLLDPDDFALDTDELRVSAGFLFGLAYPLPLTFSFGWPLRDGPGDRQQVFGFEISLFQ
jgi:outer membrane protein insertion porin family